MLYGPWREKTCLRGLRTKKAQTILRRLISTFVIFLKVSYLNLLQVKFQFSSYVAEETGLSLALSETLKTGFVAVSIFINSHVQLYSGTKSKLSAEPLPASICCTSEQ